MKYQFRKKFIQTVMVPVWVCLWSGCLDPYATPRLAAPEGYLVVEGFINPIGATSTVRLSRTQALDSADRVMTEEEANVEVVDIGGKSYPLVGSLGGIYSGNLTLDTALKYQLKITTRFNKSYRSDFVKLKITPPIDSLHWRIEGKFLNIYLNTHDEKNQTHYYFWNFLETWEYHSAFYSNFLFENGKVRVRSPSELVYSCWKDTPSTQVLVNSTTQLSEDKVNDYLIQSVPLTSEKFGIGYSILVQQYAITKEAFEYWSELQKNNENVGTIFGPQPSRSISNMYSVSDKEEPVIGFFGGSTVQTKRLFISPLQLPYNSSAVALTVYGDCEETFLPIADLASFSGVELLTTAVYSPLDDRLLGYKKSTAFCVDCRLHGGVTAKPVFWK
ncbi:MAG: DUF4249 domain-containing protein [Bacteroidetes bacterium]|nr:DUF4249 domain-containing protein [Bacteroidota bacterium]